MCVHRDGSHLGGVWLTALHVALLVSGEYSIVQSRRIHLCEKLYKDRLEKNDS